ncbi:MAG: hypothetical protein PUP93_12805 [Rhizonema sp. NSF051]|nr:hypothetical protein [Rhizonema sp. NSF051]
MSSDLQTGILQSNAQDKTHGVNIRSNPAIPPHSQDNVVHLGHSGDRVEILDQIHPQGDTHVWYRIRYITQQNIEGWVRNDVLKLDPTPPTPSPQSTLTVRTNTVFVHFPEDSSKLTDDNKVSVSVGTTYNLSAYKLENQYYRFTLAHGQLIKNKNTWYVFQDHVQIS